MAEFFQSAQRTFEIEQRAIRATMDALDPIAFGRACELMLATKGKVIVTGIGKSGHIANKLASTFASTGTAAFFLHPAEAMHGDVGMVQPDDVAIILSKSGASDELVDLLPSLHQIGVPMIAITASPESKLAEMARNSSGSVLLIQSDEEACPHNLAPTASTTAMLVLGDALAIALLEARAFTPQDFARLHPAGALGRKLTYSVSDLMGERDAAPTVSRNATLNEVMLEMSRKRYGCTAVVDQGKLLGIVTDGDLRRYFQQDGTVDPRATQAEDVMSRNPRTISADALAIEALHTMEDTLPKVMQLLVVSATGELEGIVHMHDIVKAGISA